MGEFIVVLIAWAICLIPSVIAFKKGLKYRWLVLVLNILLGWIVLPWVILMAWVLLYKTVSP